MSLTELVTVGLLIGIVLCGILLLLRTSPHSGDDHAEWDRRLALVPQHADLRSIIDRLTTVERACDVVKSELGGVKDAVTRVERMTQMLLEQQLGERS